MSETLPFECDYEYACRIEPDYECANVNCELNQMHEGDCSTEAMKPKAKTCGNCGHALQAANTATCTHKPGSVKQICHITHEACENWIPGGSLEQRYQQLEQVAVNMQKCLQAHADDWTEVAQVTAGYYADELEELGVSLDD